VADAKFLDGQYTAFGEVVNGMELVDRIVNVQRDGNDNPLQRVEMKLSVIEANA
jgi:peptidyl-prolyl cis-trans isomerase B (cyclophilin B)